MAIEVEYPIKKALGLRSYAKFAAQWSRRYAAEDRYTVLNAVMSDGADKLSRLLIYDNTRLASLNVICDINGNCLRYESIPVDSFQLRGTPDDYCIYKHVVQHLDHINRFWRLHQKRTGKELGIVPERFEFDCYADQTTVIRSTPDIQSPLECVADESGMIDDDVMASVKQQYGATGAHRRFVVFYGKIRRGVFEKTETVISLFDCCHRGSIREYTYASGAAPQYRVSSHYPCTYWSYTEDPAEIEQIVRDVMLPYWRDDTVDTATEPLELVRYDNGHRCLPYDDMRNCNWQLLLDI